MLKLKPLAVLALLPSAVLAQVTVENPAYEIGNISGTYTFEITNYYDVAISKVDYKLIAYTPGREVPWAEKHYIASVPGGVEPGEAYEIRGSAPYELMRAEGHDVEIEVSITRAYNAAGEEID